MPSEPSSPGVYVEEVPRPRSIEGVPTSVCAFVGRASRGPIDTPIEIHSFADFQRRFGGLWTSSLLGFAVRDYFTNGGSTAIIVRVYAASIGDPATAGRAILRRGQLALVAANPGSWGNQLRIRVDHDTGPPRAELGETAPIRFNLTVLDAGTGVVETHPDVTIGVAGHPRDLGEVLATESDLLRLLAPEPGSTSSRPAAHPEPVPGQSVWASDTTSTGVGPGADDVGADGDPLTQASLLGPGGVQTGLYALDAVDLFSLLVIPPYLPSADVDPVVVSAAHAYCEKRGAILLLDGPTAWNAAPNVASAAAAGGLGAIGANAAVYFPRILATNPLQSDQVEQFPAAGAIAGVLARTDARRGVWKAPAGPSATLLGVSGLGRTLSAAEVGELTKRGINCLREVPFAGPVVWGARTAVQPGTTDAEWTYLAVRRTALFIEESLRRGTQWVVFEPNGEPLWAAIRSTVDAFLDTLFRAGALQGAASKDAYLVRCDRSTMTQADIDRGVVTTIVGFAPLKPAEFVTIRIRQSTATSRVGSPPTGTPGP
jgi:Bacteriophage tail sheath protein